MQRKLQSSHSASYFYFRRLRARSRRESIMKLGHQWVPKVKADFVTSPDPVYRSAQRATKLSLPARGAIVRQSRRKRNHHPRQVSTARISPIKYSVQFTWGRPTPPPSRTQRYVRRVRETGSLQISRVADLPGCPKLFEATITIVPFPPYIMYRVFYPGTLREVCFGDFWSGRAYRIFEENSLSPWKMKFMRFSLRVRADARRLKDILAPELGRRLPVLFSNEVEAIRPEARGYLMPPGKSPSTRVNKVVALRKKEEEEVRELLGDDNCPDIIRRLFPELIAR